MKSCLISTYVKGFFVAGFLVAAVLVVSRVTTAQTGEPPCRPSLGIETGMQTHAKTMAQGIIQGTVFNLDRACSRSYSARVNSGNEFVTGSLKKVSPRDKLLALSSSPRAIRKQDLAGQSCCYAVKHESIVYPKALSICISFVEPHHDFYS